MKAFRRAAALVLLVVLSACDRDAPPTLHELTLFGAVEQRVAWLYGDPRSFNLQGASRQLDAAPTGLTAEPWTVASALWVDGAPAFLDSPDRTLSAPVEVRRIPYTSDLQVRTLRATRAVLYFDGSNWFRLGEFDPAGIDLRVVPRPRSAGLRGLTELTNAEASAAQAVLEALARPLVVVVVDASEVPRRSVDGVAESTASALYVIDDIPTDASVYRPAPRTVQYEVVARGSQAIGVNEAAYRLLRTDAELSSAWNTAYGSALTVPPLPLVDLARETMLAIFMGTKPTGGYGIEVTGVSFDAGDLFVDLAFSEPPAGAIVTQALTSPWLVVRVPRGGFEAVWFRAAGDARLIAVARRNE